MKAIPLALLVGAAALAAGSARAETHVRIGVNVGVPVYQPAPPVVYAPPPPPIVAYTPPPAVVVAPPQGYWTEVQVPTWMPERWVVRHNHWGRPERYLAPGYYTYHTERVWVEGRPDQGRGYAYGYNNSRGSDYRWNR